MKKKQNIFGSDLNFAALKKIINKNYKPMT